MIILSKDIWCYAKKFMCLRARLLQSCLTLCNPMDYSSSGSSVYEDSPDKNTGMGCHALLQGIILTQGSNPHLLCLLHWQADSLSVSWEAHEEVHSMILNQRL